MVPWSKCIFDVLVTHINSTSNQNKETSRIFKDHENEKKRAYLQRVLEIEKGHWSLELTAVLGTECMLFMNKFAEQLAKKQGGNMTL